MRIVGWLGQLLFKLFKLAVLAGLLAGVPVGLITQVPTSIPRRVPTGEQFLGLLTRPVSDTTVITLIAIALWIVWATFVISLGVELVATARGVPRPRWGPIAPLQSLASWLISGLITGVLVATPVVTLTSQPAPASATSTAPAHTVTVARTITVSPAQQPDRPTDALATSTTTTKRHADTAKTTRAETRKPAVYQVRRGDWLGAIADRYLGDFDRYPEIQRLNEDLIPAATGPRGPDHIEPGWRLILPDDATDRGTRTHATGVLVVKPTPPAPGNDEAETKQPETAAPGATTPTPKTSSNSTAPQQTPRSIPRTTAPSNSALSPTPSSATAPTAQESVSDNAAPPTADRPGVALPGGWVSIPLAAALIGAVTLLWLRRRHRYIPRALKAGDDDTDDLLPPPPAVPRMRRALREQAPELLHPAAPLHPTVTDYANTDPDQRQPLPAIGAHGAQLAGFSAPLAAAACAALTGPGADAAARGLLVAILSTGTPDDPDARGQVIIPAAALTTLLGAHAVQVDTLPRLHVTASTSEALTMVEELLIERRRQLQDYDAVDLDQMRAADPYHPPVPPILLIAEVPAPDLHARVTTTVQLGAPLAINAVLLGDWPTGHTRTVSADGHTSDDHDRLAVLDVPTTIQLLGVLHEAHTGKPATSDTNTTAVTQTAETLPDNASVTAETDTTRATQSQPADDAHRDTAQSDVTRGDTTASDPDSANEPEAPAPGPAATASARRPTTRAGQRLPVRIQLLGEPAIHDGDTNLAAVLRQHARELLVYLAVHRNGADLSEIMEVMWPNASVRRASERLSTEVADVRRRIRQAAGDNPQPSQGKRSTSAPRLQPVVNSGSRYHFDPAIVDIDLWQLTDALRAAAATTDRATRLAALQHAIDLDTGTLADGIDYDWIDQPREHLRRQCLRARVHLADLLMEDDPKRALHLYQDACDLDPLNEEVARRTMKAMAAVGDTDGIRTRLDQLRAALDTIDEELAAETIDLVKQLQRDTVNRGRPAMPRRVDR
ncbi:hypothetical protein Aca07nite_87630 [Actinoplanes capillaceus]|uniref:Bacterial transcriptional activator domain-containing protein n=1 Tax=Actinoplanes campanulatus TaxID=113559 RepID=A0ABQ3WZ91_9ACTN|nr:BTAD domain-containing putative transcriptional regulator [Actinoplanes capillaceus]GID51488.1 hypothetical protein Aca07nite_87630 [Actinoplanes capillaceus]